MHYTVRLLINMFDWILDWFQNISAAEIAGAVGALHFLLFCAVAVHCLIHRRDSRSAIIWLFSAWAFPVLGALGYAAFGVSRVPRKAWRKRRTDSHLGAARQESERESHPLAYWRSLREATACRPPESAARFDSILDRITPDHKLLSGNRITFLEDGTEAFPAMLEAIRSAQHHIHLMSYIINRDSVGRMILDACAARAREGVKVRVMYDAFGSMWARWSFFFLRYRSIPNLRIVKFSQANFLKQQFQINLRNHRKSLVVDGRVAFTGGINLHDGHVEKKSVPAIRDYHFEILGPLVNEIQYTFIRDWYAMTDESPEELLSESYFGKQDSAGTVAARLVNCGPTSLENSVEEVFFNAIVEARSEITIVTPYLVLTEPLLYALRMTAMRGVLIRLIVPANNNHKSVFYASRSQYQELLEAGVRIFERREPLLHAKAMVADGSISIFGSANMDVRSLRLNYETIVVSYDADLAGRLMGEMLIEISESNEIHLRAWLKRSRLDRLLENAWSLATPIL